VFAGNCAACHGGDGGGGSGPKLAGEEAYTNPDVVVPQIREGGGGMPGFADQLSEQELADVSAFVVEDLAP
jgi:mono/diheme cytochrome c family protein